MENSTWLSEYKTEYELLVEKYKKEWKVKNLSEEVSSQIIQEIYWPDENWKTRFDLTAEHKKKMTEWTKPFPSDDDFSIWGFNG